jgi:hypothetical protein
VSKRRRNSTGNNNTVVQAQQQQRPKITIDYAALKRLLQQNVSKTQTRSFVTYTKDKIRTYLQNPLTNLDNIRDVSQFVYRVSNIYKKIIWYYADLPLYSYNLIYNQKDWSAPGALSDFIKTYQKTATRLQQWNMPQEMSRVVASALRDGIYTGFIYDDKKSIFIQSLDPKYVKIKDVTAKGTYVVSFDAAYFNQGNNKELIYGAQDTSDNYIETDSVWDEVFKQGYEAYLKDMNQRWFELPMEKTICIIAGDDPNLPLPAFLACLPDILDLIDYSQLIRDKTELENYVLLLSKIPLIPSTKEVDDYAISSEMITTIQKGIDDIVPDLVGTVFSPCDLEPIRFDRNDQTETDIMAKATKSLYDFLGVSQVVFNNTGTTASAIAASEKGDELVSFELLQRLQSNMERYIYLNISKDYTFRFHHITCFNEKDYLDNLKNQASLGLPVKFDYATADGTTPYEVMNKTYMENVFDFQNLWKPLVSSYNTSSSATTDTTSTGGAPQKDSGALTDSGEQTRDSDKNAN